ncbi:MAG: T9SS type A sorting domain-containing protein, partial [Saprospiraceae bacterium]|nr:T9SS type A sorting domain-containing protein [Saprospiraceae bacterium]
PNEAGVACNFDQRGLPTPSYHGATFPNFPNFRLGALGEPVSPCAGYTVNSTEPPVFNAALPLLSVFPNPATAYVRVLPNRTLPEGTVWSLYDGLGRCVSNTMLKGMDEAIEVSLSGLPSGLYVWDLVAENGVRLSVGKLVVR